MGRWMEKVKNRTKKPKPAFIRRKRPCPFRTSPRGVLRSGNLPPAWETVVRQCRGISNVLWRFLLIIELQTPRIHCRKVRPEVVQTDWDRQLGMFEKWPGPVLSTSVILFEGLCATRIRIYEMGRPENAQWMMLYSKIRVLPERRSNRRRMVQKHRISIKAGPEEANMKKGEWRTKIKKQKKENTARHTRPTQMVSGFGKGHGAWGRTPRMNR